MMRRSRGRWTVSFDVGEKFLNFPLFLFIEHLLLSLPTNPNRQKNKTSRNKSEKSLAFSKYHARW